MQGQNYQVQYENALAPSGWNNLGGVLTATNSVMSALDPAPHGPARFYRVVLLQ
jgi:hypothetical protein